MGFLNAVWEKISQTKALEESSGELETAFFESVYRTLYLTGLSRSEKSVLYFAYSSIIRVGLVLLLGCELWYLFSMSSSLDNFIGNINVTFMHLMSVYRYVSMVWNIKFYKRLAMSMESPYFDISTQKRRNILEFWKNNNNKFFKLLISLGSCTLLAWYVYPLIDDLDYNLVDNVRLPFVYQDEARYPITYAVILVAFHYSAFFVMVNDLVLQAHLIHLICQFQILADCFENIISDCATRFEGLDVNRLYQNKDFQQKYFSRLGELVEQHKLILNQTMELRSILSTPMLVQVAASSMLICFVGYQVTATVTEDTVKFLMSLLYLGYNLFELFIFCRWCDEIKIQSESIRSAVYCSGWERGLAVVPGVRVRLMLVAARAGRPLVLTAGGLYDLSLTTYSTLVKTSYSALTVLLRVQHD